LPVPSGAASVIVAACTGNGCGPFSAARSISPTGPSPSAPQLGQPLGGSVVSGPTVMFTWNRVPGDNGSNTVYRLYVQDLSRATAALDVLTTQNVYSAYFRAEGARYDALVVANPGPSQVVGPAVGFRRRWPERGGADHDAADAQLESAGRQHPARLEPGAGRDAVRVLCRGDRLDRRADARRDAGARGAGAAGGAERSADALQRHRARLSGGRELRAGQ
jgi:hypothetical protein